MPQCYKSSSWIYRSRGLVQPYKCSSGLASRILVVCRNARVADMLIHEQFRNAESWTKDQQFTASKGQAPLRIGQCPRHPCMRLRPSSMSVFYSCMGSRDASMGDIRSSMNGRDACMGARCSCMGLGRSSVGGACSWMSDRSSFMSKICSSMGFSNPSMVYAAGLPGFPRRPA